MMLLIVFANNSTDVAEDESARRTCLVVYIIAQCSIFLTVIWYSFYIQIAKQARALCLAFLVPLALYVTAIFVSKEAAIGLVFGGLAIEYTSWSIIFSPIFKNFVKLEYSSALNIEHEIDRHADFFVFNSYLVYRQANCNVCVDHRRGRSGLFCYRWRASRDRLHGQARPSVAVFPYSRLSLSLLRHGRIVNEIQ